VAIGIKVVGSLLIGALVIIPAATAKNVSKNMREYANGGAVLGVLSCLFGMVLYKITNLPVGPLIILTGTLFFVISMTFRRGD
jgi:ABC-type Mn2+/Zn2+ transport system permease subunit